MDYQRRKGIVCSFRQPQQKEKLCELSNRYSYFILLRKSGDGGKSGGKEVLENVQPERNEKLSHFIFFVFLWTLQNSQTGVCGDDAHLNPSLVGKAPVAPLCR